MNNFNRAKASTGQELTIEVAQAFNPKASHTEHDRCASVPLPTTANKHQCYPRDTKLL